MPRGPVPLPTKITKFTVNRSPHIDKTSREQFEIRTHKRLIELLDPTQAAVDALIRLEVPPLVSVDIKIDEKNATLPNIAKAHANGQQRTGAPVDRQHITEPAEGS